ncbi:MAG TPA: glycoside hydrolase family 38 C-terminal domain-containing protein [Gemmatimonadales bacterium]|nr:glycoside hydrolase family 38 C-terminal domain-containing protein [Gemmatimonadales bacterium]
MSGLTVHLIPHTHWDREWYLPRAAFVARLVPALDDLLDRLDASPEFRSFFLDGQTVLLEDYLRVRPEQRARVSALVRAGRLQVGPWYVLADEIVPSGESLIRNLLLGRNDTEALGGRAAVMYSPDAFGHPAAWPALAAEFGMSHGVLWRGLGGEPGQEGDLFRWYAPDGRSILLHHLPPDGYEAGSGLVEDPHRLRQAWSGLKPVLVRRAATSHLAVTVGADHHAAPAAIGRVRDLLAALEPNAEVRVSRFDEYFRAAEAQANGVPTLRGELRWSYGYTWTLQGVQATRAPLKRRHAEAELLLERTAEPLAALAFAAGRGDRRPLLRDTWRTLVRSQFHDSIGGCTSDAVARRVAGRLDDVLEAGRELARSSLDALTGNDPDRARDHPADTAPRLVLWNPVARERSGAVVVADLTWFRRDVLVGPPGGREPRRGDGARAIALLGADGPIALQPLGRVTSYERLDAARHYPDQDEVDLVRVAFRAPPLPGLGFAVLEPAERQRAVIDTAVRAGHRSLDNGLLALTIAQDGTVTLADRRTGLLYPSLLGFESAGDSGDTYTWAPRAGDRTRRMTTPVAVRTLARGPLVAALEVRGRLTSSTGAVELRLLLTLHAGSPVLRCTVLLDNRATDHRLRLRVPTGVPGVAAVAGTQFGTVMRAAPATATSHYARETPVTTAPAQRILAVADSDRGLALLAPGFFEYELDANGDLRVTLLRAVGQLSREDLPTRPGHAGWPTATPMAQCPGPDRLQLAIVPVEAADLWAGSRLAELWEDVFLPPRALWLRQATPLSTPACDIRLEGKGLVFSSAKPPEQGDGLVLRCWNARGEVVSGAWRLGRAVARAIRVRADERATVDELMVADGGHTVPLIVEPHGIATVRVELAGRDS